MDAKNLDHLASWKETLLALIPFLLLPGIYLFGLLLSPFITSQPEPNLALGIFFSVIGGFLFAMLTGWVKNFSRWVFPYWGFILLITLYMRDFSGTIAGYWVDGSWWVWTPVIAIAIFGTLWARSLKPVYSLITSVWKDWTLLSFAFYGALPLLFLFAYDEVHGTPFEYVIQSTAMLILAVGTAIYMRTDNIWHRFASLVGGYTLSWLVVMIHLSFYWNGRQLFWMTEPGSWLETLNWTSQMGVFLMLILVAPLLVALLRQTITIIQTPKNA
ncbi:MAG: hypothetical protein PVJ21_10080 [Anaerolineales bacterium]|jgi:hypothetical protein